MKRLRRAASLVSTWERGIVERPPPWMIAILLFMTSLPLLSAMDAPIHGDVRLYERVADTVMSGIMPYRDQEFEYPPYAILFFIAAWLLTNCFALIDYQFAFALLVVLADSTLKGVLLGECLKQGDRFRDLVPLVVYCLAVPFITGYYLQRYDIFVCLLTIAAICCLTSGRFGLAGALLAIGGGTKLYPILLTPVMWSLANRRSGGTRFLIGTLWGFIPLAVLGLFLPWWRFLEFHYQRGLQAESLYASVVWFAHLIGLTNAAWITTDKSTDVMGQLAQTLTVWGKAVMGLATFGSVALAASVVNRCPTLTTFQLSRLALIPLLAFVGFNTVLSLQFFLWLLPLAALGILGGDCRPMLVIVAATVITPYFYSSLQHATPFTISQTLLLLFRNLALLVVWLMLVREFWKLGGMTLPNKIYANNLHSSRS